MLRPLRPIVGLATCAVAILLLSPVGISPARTQAREFAVRYAVVHAKPTGAVVYASDELPPIFSELQRGSPHALNGTPEAFGDVLQREEPNFDFELHLAGETRCPGGGTSRIAQESQLTGALSVANQAIVNLEAKDASTVKLRLGGGWRYRLPGETAEHTFGWDAHSDEWRLDHTYSIGVVSLETGERLALLMCVVD